MTPKLPRVTAAEAIRGLERAGFTLSRQSGSHKIYKNAAGRRVTVPYHAGPILHPKVAIAVDEDVNIFNYWEILWAINTRCNPQEDIVVIPWSRIHPMDPKGFEPVPPGGPYWQRVGGKVIIDATKPPVSAGEEARKPFQRLKPMGWQTVRLEDFLP